MLYAWFQSERSSIVAEFKPDRFVRGVLWCLSDGRKKSLTEVTFAYNQRFPPPLLGLKRGEGRVKKALESLIEHGFVEAEVLSFTTEVIPETKHYSITQLGLHYLGQKS